MRETRPEGEGFEGYAFPSLHRGGGRGCDGMGRSRRPHPPGRRVMVEQAPRRPPAGLGRRRMVPLDGRGVMALGRWRVVPLWRVAILHTPVSQIRLMMEVFFFFVVLLVLVVIVH